MLAIIGIAVMVLGAALVIGARLAAASQPLLERWGGHIFVGGIVIWALHFAI